MRSTLLKLIRWGLHAAGAEIVPYERDREVARHKKILGGLMELAAAEKFAERTDTDEFLLFANKFLHLSKSQLLQDLFVLYELRGKINGYFVEFGATNGVNSSNSFLLETQCGWDGILAEPGKIWREALEANRRAKIDFRCVWRESRVQLDFNEVSEPELSTINTYSDHDRYWKSRQRGAKYPVETVSLNDLLKDHGAPLDIDYLSIDTEGSEIEILRALNWERYRIKVITCEHNYTEERENIYQLLTSKGYRRKFEALSQVDDWYVRMM